ncbi:ABC transporter ATP-binding protein [Arthrobacter sp. R4]|uniref:ABC transporter ATP-binding protein n=1 Tax=Arthrobacter sp. R4 TaxID=644417 RepID=UPI003EDAF70A
MSSVVIKDLTKNYGANTVVDGISLDIADGEFLTLLGPSGCGKTTTLRCIAGLENPDGGRITIGDATVVDGTFRVPPNRRDAGMVFQSYALWPHMTVAGNVSYPLKMRKIKGAEISKRVNEALEVVGLGHMYNRSVGSLSGGQQQRVALARAFVAHPALLLFDEPLSNLDAKLRGTMRTELKQLHRRIGTTSVYVTHDQVEALTMSDRIAVMNGGHIQQIGTPDEVYSTPRNAFVADFLGYENILSGTVLGRDGERTVVDVDDVGAITCSSAAVTAATGDRAKVAIRATAVKLHEEDTDRINTFPAHRANVIFLGDQIEHIIKAGPFELKVRTNTADYHASTERTAVQVEFPPASVVLLEA